MFKRAFWEAVAERALVTAAQAWLLYVGAVVGDVGQFDALSFNWLASLGFAAGGAVLSVVKGIATNVVTKDGPGIGSAEVVEAPKG